MLNKVCEYEYELNFSWCSWLCNYISFGEEYVCEYGWYGKTINQLELLNTSTTSSGLSAGLSDFSSEPSF